MRWITGLLLLALATPGLSAEYAVVVSRESGITSMDANRIRDVFLRRRNFEGDIKLVPVNPLGEDELRRRFEETVLMMDRDAVSRYWTTSHFQGISPPTTQASLESVKRFVQRVQGAIGYLPVQMVDDQVRVLYEF